MRWLCPDSLEAGLNAPVIIRSTSLMLVTLPSGGELKSLAVRSRCVDKTAKYFRGRAEHCRLLATGATDGPRDDLLRVAADLDQEADEMDAEEAASSRRG